MTSNGHLHCSVIKISMKSIMISKMELIKLCKKIVNLFKRKLYKKIISTANVDLKEIHFKSKSKT